MDEQFGLGLWALILMSGAALTAVVLASGGGPP
jgi:hypothetical protein